MSVKEAVAAFREEFLVALDKPGRVWGIPTGVYDIDERTGGLHPGDLTIVGARPGMGKTSLLLHFAASVCKTLVANREARVVGFISAEMSRTQVIRRLVSQEAHVKVRDIQTGLVSNPDLVFKVADEIGQWPLYIDDTVSPTLTQVRETLTKWASGLPAESVYGMILVDHIGKIQGTWPNGHVIEREYTAQTSVAEALFKMARYYKTPVVAAAQLSRRVEERDNKRPLLSDLRDSGRIEENADVVMMLYRSGYYDALQAGSDCGPGPLEISIAKGRNVGVGTATAHFDPEYTSITDMPPSDLSQVLQAA